MSCACLHLGCDKENELCVLIFGQVMGEGAECAYMYIWSGDGESEMCVLTFGLVTSNDQVSGGRWGVGRSGFRSCTLCRPNFRADGSGRPRGRGPLTTLNTM